MTPGAERIAILITPLLAMATFAVGLRVGAAGAKHAALVYGAPPAASRNGLAWQLLTVREEAGIREAVPMQDISVNAREGGRQTEWRGATNSDGIAELWLDLPGVQRGEAIELVVEAAGEQAPLAHGSVRWQEVAWGANFQAPPWVPPSKRDGELAIDVAVYGQKVAPGFPTGIWARVRDRETGQPASNVTLDAEPEPGLLVALPSTTTCDNGWAALTVTAQMHVVGLALHASQHGNKRGEWFGALPVAPGGSDVPLPTEARPGTALKLSVLVPTVRSLVYVEVDDQLGRAYATALPVTGSSDGSPRGELTVPPLSAGLYWVVTAGDPRGAESVVGGAVARPVLVREGEPMGRCERGPALAKSAGPFPRWLALDGTTDATFRDDRRRRTGLLLAWGALGVAGALEALLLLRAVARARRAMAGVARQLAGDEASVPELAPPFGIVNVAIGILLALLGFALVGSLLTLRAQ